MKSGRSWFSSIRIARQGATTAALSPGRTYELEMITDTRADRIVIGVLDDESRKYGVVRVMIEKR